MSRSPERMSSYRRHFEDSSCSCYQVRVSSPSPTRRETREASVGYSCRAGASSMRGDSVGRRKLSAVLRTRLLGGGVSAGVTVCVGPNGETPMDLDVAAAENQEFLKTRSGERQEMVVLNDRLAGYIDKVRSLEQQNKLLEAEIEAYRNRFQKPTGLRLLYEEQLKELRKIAEQMRVQRDISLAAKDARTAQLEAVKIKYEEAVKLRKKAERDVEALRPDVDKATSSCIAMEKKLEQLEAEIEFLKRVHQQEIDELMKQIHSAHVSVQNVFDLPDMAAALKQIQTQYDSMAAKNLQEMDSWYKNKFEDLTSKTSRQVNTTRSFREELSGAKRDIQSKENYLENLRTRNEALEAQIREKREKYRQDLEDLQARIEALQLELKSTKEKIAVHLREYQDLLNIKMSLEMEITTYRKLIEGEDLRLSGMMQTVSLTHCSTSAIGAGMSSGGGGMGGVGGMGGGVIEDSGGSIGGMVSEVGRLGSGAGGLGLRIGAGGLGYRKGPAGRARGADMVSRHGFDAGGVGASARDAGTGGVMGDAGISGAGSGADGVDARHFGSVGGSALGNSGGGIGAAGLDTSSRGVGAVGLGTGSGGVGAAGLGTVAGGVGAAGFGFGTDGVGASGLGSGAGGVGVSGLGSGAGGVGVSGLGSGAGGVGVSGLGSGAGGVGVSGGKVDSRVNCSEMGAGSGSTGSCSIGDTGMGFRGGSSNLDAGKNDGIGQSIYTDGGKDFRIGGGIKGRTGSEGANGGPLSDTGGMGDPSVIIMGYGSTGYGPINDTYIEQAVELTKRRTVLIRTIRCEDDVLWMDLQEKTYTITGAADDSDDD